MKQVTRVFWISLIIIIPFIIWGMLPEDLLGSASLNNVTSAIQGFLTSEFGWFYVLSMAIFVVVAFYLMFSKYGKIRLGKPDEKPEYSYISWFAMLFSAGMGIGLIFWGVAEPLSFLDDPPYGESGTQEAAQTAMQYSFLHWGFHPWAVYAILGLALAYFKYRRQSSGLVSSTLEPLFGDRMKGGWGTLIDVLVVFATIFGVATSLGLGAAQVAGGITSVFGGNSTVVMQLIIIAVFTVLFLLSSMTGINKGIKWLSNTNLVLALFLMLFVFILGPSTFILNLYTSTLGQYVQNLPSMSLRMSPFSAENNQWIQDWTVFYWAWWIAWSTFVGTFIARVSRGRTIREFVSGVVLVPAVIGTIWFAVMGGAGINAEMNQGGNLIQQMNNSGTEVALFSLLDGFPMGTFISIIAVVLISVFFITSADSATFVLGMQTTGGSLEPNTKVRFTWGIIQSATAAILLWTGGLGALQTASHIAAFPFAIILLLVIVSLIKALRADKKAIDRRAQRRVQENKTNR